MNKTYRVIGVMSGTSLDGLDLICADFEFIHKKWKFNIQYTETIEYDKNWRDTLENAYHYTGENLTRLDIDYGNFLGSQIIHFISKNSIEKIDFISSHGHTVFHNPELGYTLQIGNGPAINFKTKIPIYNDFRVQDVLLGGQGAPLVPVGDLLLFDSYKYCLNLGGFANISIKNRKGIVAFDICPVNIVLNKYANKLGFEFDKDGFLASKGKCNKELLHALNNLDFYGKNGPKSLGKEFVENKIIPLIESIENDEFNILRTFCEHVAFQINRSVGSTDLKSVLVTGGGVFNKFLMNMMKNRKKGVYFVPDTRLVEFKEALIFAFLGVLKHKEQPNCLSSVTGAIQDHSSGMYHNINLKLSIK